MKWREKQTKGSETEVWERLKEVEIDRDRGMGGEESLLHLIVGCICWEVGVPSGAPLHLALLEEHIVWEHEGLSAIHCRGRRGRGWRGGGGERGGEGGGGGEGDVDGMNWSEEKDRRKGMRREGDEEKKR
jgi:hypothetical protein